MNKADSTIISYITRKSTYTEILKFIFHNENHKYKHMIIKLSRIVSKYTKSNITPQQSTIINLLHNLLISYNSKETSENKKILSDIAINNSGFNSVILDTIEQCKDSSFEDIEIISKNIYNIVSFIESVQLVSDCYVLFENVLNQDVVSYHEVMDIVKKSYASFSNTLINITKNSNDDNFISTTNIVEEISRLKEDEKNIYTIPTNVKVLDDYKLVTSSRLTMFASPTNHGKTTVMSCIAARCAKNLLNNKSVFDKVKRVKKNKKIVVCFITLEESEVDIRKRLLANILGESKDSVENIDSLIAEYKIKQHLKHDESENVLLYVKYMPSGSTVTDVESVLQNLQNRDADPVIVVIDYMDKLTSSLINSDIYRLQLTSVSYELRNISVKYNIPVITATQLNKESIARARLDLDLVAESYGKTWEADSVVVFRQKTENNLYFLELSIPKSRHTNRLVEPVLIPMDYSKNDILDNIVYTSFDKQSNGTPLQYVKKTSNYDAQVYDLDI